MINVDYLHKIELISYFSLVSIRMYCIYVNLLPVVACCCCCFSCDLLKKSKGNNDKQEEIKQLDINDVVVSQEKTHLYDLIDK